MEEETEEERVIWIEVITSSMSTLNALIVREDLPVSKKSPSPCSEPNPRALFKSPRVGTEEEGEIEGEREREREGEREGRARERDREPMFSRTL